MAFLRLLMRRQLPQAVVQLARVAQQLRPPAGGLHGSARLRVADKGPWGKSSRGTEQQQQQQQHQYQHQHQHQHQLTDLDKADALMLRKSHETGFLSWFRNGLLATGIGVIAFVQSEVGREAGYAFFILGGMCVSFGGASYVGSLLALRRLMLLSVPALLLQGGVVGSVALFWLCAVSLYIGRLEVEIIHEDEEEGGLAHDDDDDDDHGAGGECRECRERREHRGHRGNRHHDDNDDGKPSK